MISVGIIEDDDIVRDIITRYINDQPDMRCIISADSMESFDEQVNASPLPQIILSDIGLPGINGIEGIKRIKHKWPGIEIIMLTIYDDSHKIFEALKAGASGYLVKNNSLEDIRMAIEHIQHGGSPLSSQVARKVIEYFKPKKQSPLSNQEQRIVQGFIDGLSYKMIADRMNISVDGIRYHIKNMYRKLHVNSKAEVLKKSFEGEI